ncbi:hypothetical protein NHL50_12840 [Acidimicrobiia bacterium EGI L10123]|uniref:hypothetical protein n=1 Tax=Salinilacustrithrix flava TaxID=2957203 RepID=UPI003D7C223E|nr:hypothetical protein [Acidimicrobiia bacterium EGI L10123]
MRFRLGGCAVALVLVLSACGVGSGSDSAAPDVAAAETMELVELASARDTLPPAPHAATSLTVLLTHSGGAADPGLDAAAAALAQRPDIRVAIAAAGTSSDGGITMSGFPVTGVNGTDLVASSIAATGHVPELVVVGIDRTDTPGAAEAIAAAAADAGVPALVVVVEGGDQVDHAAAAMQLLEVLDLELDALLDEPAAVHRLVVPSCRSGSLRGRLVVRPTPTAAPLGPSDCTSADRSVPDDEASAVGAGYASLSRLP